MVKVLQLVYSNSVYNYLLHSTEKNKERIFVHWKVVTNNEFCTKEYLHWSNWGNTSSFSTIYEMGIPTD